MDEKLLEHLVEKDELFAQIGSKRQWVDRVKEMVQGKHIGTVFDPCAGAGHLPIAVAEDHSAKLILNDLNQINFYYLKRRCEGGKISDDNFEKWKSSPKVNGYFTENFKKPKKSLRRYMDGLVTNANHWLKKAYLSDLLRRIFHRGDVPQTGKSDITTVPRAKSYLQKIHEADDYGMEVECRISNKSIEDLDFPESDLCIFDPPYKGQASPQTSDAEVLMQEELELSFPHDRLREILQELKSVSRHQIFFGGEEEKEIMEDLGLKTERWESTTGGVDWSKGQSVQIDYVYSSISSELKMELSKMKTEDLLRIEMGLEPLRI